MNAIGTTPVVNQLMDSMPNTQKPEQKNERAFSDVWKDIQAKYGEKEEVKRVAKKSLDKDDFMKIMITQLQHQDPSKPLDAEKMATEMAQITSVEQLHNMSKSIDKLSDQNKPMERLALMNLIGKTVTADRNRFDHRQSEHESLSFRLNEDATEVKVALVADSGETVLEKDLGAMKAGENTFLWDGKKGNTLPANGGGYTLRISAKDAQARPVQAETQVKAQVMGVGLEGSEPVLLVGTGNTQSKVLMKNVIRVESNFMQPQGVASAQTTEKSDLTSSPIAPKDNFFTFEKGKGSKPLDLSALTPEAKNAINAYSQQKNQDSRSVINDQGVSRVQEEKGFPSGLSGSNRESLNQNSNEGG